MWVTICHIPPRVRARRGIDRFIARESLRGTLPESIRQRSSKGRPVDLVHRGLRQEERHRIEGLCRDSRAEAFGFLDAQQLHNHYQAYVRQATDAHQSWVRSLYLEAWLRNRA